MYLPFLFINSTKKILNNATLTFICKILAIFFFLKRSLAKRIQTRISFKVQAIVETRETNEHNSCKVNLKILLIFDWLGKFSRPVLVRLSNVTVLF